MEKIAEVAKEVLMHQGQQSKREAEERIPTTAESKYSGMNLTEKHTTYCCVVPHSVGENLKIQIYEDVIFYTWFRKFNIRMSILLNFYVQYKPCSNGRLLLCKMQQVNSKIPYGNPQSSELSTTGLEKNMARRLRLIKSHSN